MEPPRLLPLQDADQRPLRVKATSHAREESHHAEFLENGVFDSLKRVFALSGWDGDRYGCWKHEQAKELTA